MSSQFNFSVAARKDSQLTRTQSYKPQQSIAKTRLTKKYTVEGFVLTDLLWMKPSQGTNKYEVLVRYIDPEAPKTKREDGAYQKVIKFGQKGAIDFVDPPYSVSNKNKQLKRLSANINNPLHPNFYVVNILNGDTTDVYQNFNILKRKIFKQ